MTARALLEARDLELGYRGSPPLTRGLELEVHRGEMVAVTGPSGSGKSTLMYVLGLMLRPRAGAVHLDGTRVDALPDRERARVRAERIGFVFQDAALDPSRTVLDNVLETVLYRRRSRGDAVPRALELLERFGVAARATGRPGQISGGQAQRIALCRALLAIPSVVLADEPTGNLDPASAEVVVQALGEQAAAGSGVVIVTHSDAVAAACDRQVSL